MRFAGRPRWRPTGWSYTPSHLPARSNGARRPRRTSYSVYARAATLANSVGLGINAGHDLDLDNLQMFRRLPHLDEVSIGHALMSHALFVGLERSVREYLEVLAG